MTTLTTTPKTYTLTSLFTEACRTQVAIDKANGRKLAVGNELLALAKASPSLNDFLAECDTLEATHKASNKKDTTVPRVWTQAKSNLKAAIKLNIDLTGHGTESSMRKALNDKRKANKAEKEDTNKHVPDSLEVMLSKVHASFTDSTQRDDMARMIESLVLQQMKANAAPVPTTPTKVKAVA